MKKRTLHSDLLTELSIKQESENTYCLIERRKQTGLEKRLVLTASDLRTIADMLPQRNRANAKG